MKFDLETATKELEEIFEDLLNDLKSKNKGKKNRGKKKIYSVMDFIKRYANNLRSFLSYKPNGHEKDEDNGLDDYKNQNASNDFDVAMSYSVDTNSASNTYESNTAYASTKKYLKGGQRSYGKFIKMQRLGFGFR
jgi:hypothetical protein